MKRNRIMCGVAALVVLTTMVISIGTVGTSSQQAVPNKQDDKGLSDLTRLARADFDAPLPDNAVEKEKRKLKNKRYDDEDWVTSNPHYDTGMIGRYDEKIPAPLIPMEESALVIVGKIDDHAAHLSNDKRGVYREYKVQIEQILKNDSANNQDNKKFVWADREGGFVRYRDGKKVLYKNSTKELPAVGGEYLMFLTHDRKSDNYAILTLYELKEDAVVQLDSGRLFDEFKGLSKVGFLEAVRNRISESAATPKN